MGNACRESQEETYLLLGTSTGHVQLHDSNAQLLHRQRLHAKAVTAISVRCAGMQAGSDDASEDITVCFEDAVARVSSLEVPFSLASLLFGSLNVSAKHAGRLKQAVSWRCMSE